MEYQEAVLQVIPHLETGGAELSTLEVVEALHAIGVGALVATQGGRMAKEVERLGGEIISLSAATKNPLEMLRNKRRLQNIIKERNVSLIHARSRAPAWSSLLAAKKTGIPFVTTYHGAYGESHFIKRFYNSVMARGDRVIANSRFTADLVHSRYQTSPELLRVIYRGVNIERFSAKSVSKDRLDRLVGQWQLPAERKIILHPARLTRWKGQRVVIAALEKLISEGRDDQAIVAIAGDHQGRTAYVEELKGEIAAAGLKDRIFLVGHCSDMAAAYALAHVTIIASIEPEAFGRTSAEAQAMGCPVIATNIGAPPETVRAQPVVGKNKMTGWLVAPDQPDELADALHEALHLDERAYRRLAENAVRNVAENFSDQRLKISTLAVYDELLGTGFSSLYRDKTGAG